MASSISLASSTALSSANQRPLFSRKGMAMAVAPPTSTNSAHFHLQVRCQHANHQATYYSWYSSKPVLETKMNPARVTTSVPVRVAHELLQAGHRYLDVRTSEEFNSGGHVRGAINVPYLIRLGYGMTKNPDFLDQVSRHFSEDDEILVGCQSGKRSFMATTDLQAAGFTGVVDVSGGYDAWKWNGLPSEGL